MKKLIVGLLMLISLQFVSGQDKIITSQQDTIFCRIVSISSSHIQYEQKVENQYVGKFIPTEQVLAYFRNTQSSEPDHKYSIDRQRPKPAHRWLIGVYPGRASLLASTTNDEKEMIDLGIPKKQAVDYNKKLNRGWSISGDIHYLFSDYFGLGAKYSLFTSSVKQDFTIAINSMFPEYACVGVKEKFYIHYAGPSVIFRQLLDEKTRIYLTETLSVGYVHFRDETRMDPNQYTFHISNIYGLPSAVYNFLTEGKTWGANAGLSIGYFPVSRLSVGVNAGFMYARLTKLELSTKQTSQTLELDKRDYENLTRFDYSFYIRFHL